VNEPTQPKWPHLENIDKQPSFLTDAEWITVTEKIHGMNVRFGKTPDGTFWVGSRNNVVLEGKQVQGFYEWAQTRVSDTPNGYTFFGEWAGKGIQKGINYGDKRFYLFGVSKYVEKSYGFLDWHSIANWATLMACKSVPVLYDGPWPSMTIDKSTLNDWRTGQSLTDAEEDREGICITTWPASTDKYGNPLIIKWKNAAFAEVASAREKRAPADLTNVQPFVDEYATVERLEHVLSHVGEDLDTKYNPLDRENTGAVLRAYYEDVMREGAEDFAKLSENDQRLVGKVLNKPVKVMLDDMRTTTVLA
jgi:hypothetical protein